MITDADQLPPGARRTVRDFEAWLADAVTMGIVRPGWDIRWEEEHESLFVRFTTSTGAERDLVDATFAGYLAGVADMAGHLATRGR